MLLHDVGPKTHISLGRSFIGRTFGRSFFLKTPYFLPSLNNLSHAVLSFSSNFCMWRKSLKGRFCSVQTTPWRDVSPHCRWESVLPVFAYLAFETFGLVCVCQHLSEEIGSGAKPLWLEDSCEQSQSSPTASPVEAHCNDKWGRIVAWVIVFEGSHHTVIKPFSKRIELLGCVSAPQRLSHTYNFFDCMLHQRLRYPDGRPYSEREKLVSFCSYPCTWLQSLLWRSSWPFEVTLWENLL